MVVILSPSQGGEEGGKTSRGKKKNGGPKNPSSKTTASAIEEMLFKARFVASRVLKKNLFLRLIPILLARVGSPAACRGGGGPSIRNADQYLQFGAFGLLFQALSFAHTCILKSSGSCMSLY